MPDAQAPGTWTPTEDEQDDLRSIDAAITRMQNVTPQDPYRLTIPQDEPRYHHTSATQAGMWLTSTPFHRSEHETAQYLTYHFHEPGKETYVLENSWSVEEPKVNGTQSKHKSAPGVTTNGAPKKKISLGAYRKQKTGGIDTPDREAAKGADAPAKQPAVKGPIERVKAESEEILAAVNGSEEEVPSLKHAQLQRNDLKRKRGDEVASEPGNDIEATIAPPTKKAKASPQDEATSRPTQTSTVQDSQGTDSSSKQEKSEESGLPPRLSPGMPPKLSPPLPAKLSPLHKAQDSNTPNREEAQDLQDTPSLPSRLSPTLPDNIAKSLQAKSHPATPKPVESYAPNSVSKDKDNRLTPVKNAADGITKRKSPAPRNGFRANSSSPAVRSDAEDRIRPKNATTRAKTPERKYENETSVQKDVISKPQETGKPSLLVKIKYKKARKEDIQRILKMRPRLHFTMSRAPDLQPSEEEKPSAKIVERRNGDRKDTGPVKGVAQKIGPVKKEKKPQPPLPPSERPREEGRLEKREEKHEEKHKEGQEKQPEKLPEKQSLPDEDKTSAPTKRRKAESSETRIEPSTPAQREVDSPLAPKSGLQATPSARKELLSHAMRREQSQDSNTTHNTPPAQISTPSLTSNQTNGLSKAPSSQPSTKTPKQQAWETEQKRLETLGRELKHAASAYLNASQSSDTSGSTKDHKLAAVKSIESFLCYLLAFSCLDEANLAAEPKQSPSYTTWRSLHGFYGFVKRNTEQFPPLCGLSCSLGVVYTARILEIAAKFPTDGPSRTSILETHAALQKAANEAERKLDIDALQEAFPKSWSQRSKSLSATERLESTKLGGGFKLPIGLATTAVRAARAGHVMLQEWLEREKIDYTLKLKL